ncbi:MAG: LysR family transcriptional regulator [Hyphomicrobiales bacterium]|nr:MAG: LysR family transcriptional regulator [Hyphomicrobiales bacterium]
MKLLPSLKQLEYLTALDDSQHFGKAAEACHVSPSTLSAGVRDLEQLLGAPVAERTKRRVVILPLGQEIASRARRLLRDAEDIMALAAARNAPLTGLLRLGVIPTIAPFLLPMVMPGLHAAYPDLRLVLREDQTEALLADLRGGQIDLALIALPYELDGLTSLDLFEDRFQLACPAGHELAGKKLIVHQELADQPLLLLEEGHCLRGHALEACHLDRHRRMAEFEATSMHTLVQMVATGLGITLLPQIAIDARITAATDIRLIPLAGGDASRRIGLVWRRASPRAAEFALLGKALTPAGH